MSGVHTVKYISDENKERYQSLCKGGRLELIMGVGNVAVAIFILFVRFHYGGLVSQSYSAIIAPTFFAFFGIVILTAGIISLITAGGMRREYGPGVAEKMISTTAPRGG